MSDSHSHAHEPMQLEADRPKSGIIGVMIVITIVSVIGICVGVNEYFKAALESELQSKVYGLVDSRLTDLRAEEEQKLNHYQWVDAKHEQVRVPLERARELTLADYRAAALPPAAPAPSVSGSAAAPTTPGSSAASVVPVAPVAPAAPKGSAGPKEPKQP